ncbi:transcriptional regulator [Cutibacterium acnes JCM 18920]|nr:transcriptional regulator [Cutibacterium acnes JCM 18920]
MDRTTIKDIARVAGVSPGAVSFALNDKPGVSDSTRARVKAVAKDLGWRPNVAARALSANRLERRARHRARRSQFCW